jgi:hypothetical protein
MGKKNGAGSCGCCACPADISKLFPEYVYYDEVKCFLYRSTQTNITTFVGYIRRTISRTPSGSESVIGQQQFTVTPNSTTSETVVEDEVTEDLTAGRFIWTGGSLVTTNQFIFDYEEFVTVSASTGNEIWYRFFQPFTRTTTNITVTEEYRLALAYTFDNAIVGELDVDEEMIADFAYLRARVEEVLKTGFTTSTSKNTAAVWRGFADEPTSRADFDTKFAAAAPNITASDVFPIDATNIIARLPTTNGARQWLLGYSTIDNLGGHVSRAEITISDRSFLQYWPDYAIKWDRPDWRTLILKPAPITRHGFFSLANFLNSDFFEIEENSVSVEVEVALKPPTGESETYTEIATQDFALDVDWQEVSEDAYGQQYEMIVCVESTGDFGTVRFGERRQTVRPLAQTEAELREDTLEWLLSLEPQFTDCGPLVKFRETIAELAFGSSDMALIDGGTSQSNLRKWSPLCNARSSEELSNPSKEANLRLTITVTSDEFQVNEFERTGLQDFDTGKPKKCPQKATCELGQELTHLNWSVVNIERGNLPLTEPSELSKQDACGAELEKPAIDLSEEWTLATQVFGFKRDRYYIEDGTVPSVNPWFDQGLSGKTILEFFTSDGETARELSLETGQTVYDDLNGYVIGISVSLGTTFTLSSILQDGSAPLPVVSITSGLGIGLMYRRNVSNDWEAIAQFEVPTLGEVLDQDDIDLILPTLGQFTYFFRVGTQLYSLDGGEIDERPDEDEPPLHRYMIADAIIKAHVGDPVFFTSPSQTTHLWTQQSLVTLSENGPLLTLPGYPVLPDTPATVEYSGNLRPEGTYAKVTESVDGVIRGNDQGSDTFTAFELEPLGDDVKHFYYQRTFGSQAFTELENYEVKIGNIVLLSDIVDGNNITLRSDTADVMTDELANEDEMIIARSVEATAQDENIQADFDVVVYESGPLILTVKTNPSCSVT